MAALADQQAELSELLAGLDDHEWARPSRCEGWSVADVVLHLAQTNELAIASATGRFVEVLAELTSDAGPAKTVDDGAAVMVERDRGRPGPAVFERWRVGAERFGQVLAEA